MKDIKKEVTKLLKNINRDIKKFKKQTIKDDYQAGFYLGSKTILNYVLHLINYKEKKNV